MEQAHPQNPDLLPSRTVRQSLRRCGLFCRYCGDPIPAEEGYYSIGIRVFCADCIENADLCTLSDIAGQPSVRDFLHEAGIYWRG